MGDFPANGRWTIYSVQKTLPIIGKLGAIFGAHNYLALVDPDGNFNVEMHGVFSDVFVVNGPSAADYLKVRMHRPHDYMEAQSIISAKPVFFGEKEDLLHLMHIGFRAAAKSLDATRMLYNGATLFGHSVNSNSVWYTALKAMGVSDPSRFDGWGSAPGNKVDLRKEPTNNRWPGEAWIPNPSFDSIYPDAPWPPLNGEFSTDELGRPLDQERELADLLWEVEYILDDSDDAASSVSIDFVADFINDVHDLLERVGDRIDADLFDQLHNAQDRLEVWREVLEERNSSHDQSRPPADDWRDDDPEPAYAWSDPDPPPEDDDDDDRDRNRDSDD